MIKLNKRTIFAVVTASALVMSCASLNPFAKADARWADYKSWTKITEGKPGTGDPTGFIGNVHNGPDGYREVYVNDIGAAALAGNAPYNYPEGTIIVKEQFKDKAGYDAGKVAAVTVSVKATGSETLSKENWLWADSYKGKAKTSDFCSGCHSIAAKDDFVFTNGAFLATQ